MKKICLCLPLVSLLTLASCMSGEPPRYVIVNETREDIVAATFSDASGVFAATKADAAQYGYAQVLETGGRHGSGGAITVQWLSSAGRARWHQARIIVGNARKSVKIVVWPDLKVCLREQDEGIHNAPDSCVIASEMPALDPGMASRLGHRTVTRDAPFFAEHRGRAQTSHVLEEKGRAVALFGKDEFLSAYPIGKQAGWIVTGWIGGETGMFVISGAPASGWTSRYLGRVEQIAGVLPPSRMMLAVPQGYRFLVDTGNADIFLLPGVANRDYTILGQSPDGKQLAVAASAEPRLLGQQRVSRYHLQAIDLEEGTILRKNSIVLPPLPKEAGIESFYGPWHREHCTWTPVLSCA